MKIFNKYFWYDLKYKIYCWFKPKQKWLTKEIPRDWCDKTELIRIVLFSCLKNFVEEEKGISDYDWSKDVESGHLSQQQADKIKQRDAELKEAYDYITVGRAKLEKKYYDAAPPRRPIDEIFVPYEDNPKYMRMVITDEEKECYERMRKIEEKINRHDDDILMLIVKHRHNLWT